MHYLLEHALILAGLVFIFNPALYLFYYLILNRTNEKFRNLPWDTKTYVLKNLSKSSVLVFLSVATTIELMPLILYGKVDNDYVTKLGHLYSSTDIAGLLFVRNLSLATKLHHYAVCCCTIFNIFQDFSQDGLHRALITLTYLSIIPYTVNTLLGLRHLGFPLIKKRIAQFSSVIYAISIVCNIIFQHVYPLFYCSESIWFRLAWIGLYQIILHDDLKLEWYLIKVAGWSHVLEPYLEKCQYQLDKMMGFVRQVVSCQYDNISLILAKRDLESSESENLELKNENLKSLS